MSKTITARTIINKSAITSLLPIIKEDQTLQEYVDAIISTDIIAALQGQRKSTSLPLNKPSTTKDNNGKSTIKLKKKEKRRLLKNY